MPRPVTLLDAVALRCYFLTKEVSMKFPQILISLFVVTTLLSCGGDDTTTTPPNPNTDGSTAFQATLSVSASNPANGNGEIEVTGVTSDVNPAGGNQSVHVLGKTTIGTGEDAVVIKHQIDINYYISFVGGETFGNVTQVSHAWGTSLEGALDGGISVCEDEDACSFTHLNPTLNTIVFASQALSGTPNLSTIGGTVVYP